jgi:hypothetical protein
MRFLAKNALFRLIFLKNAPNFAYFAQIRSTRNLISAGFLDRDEAGKSFHKITRSRAR